MPEGLVASQAAVRGACAAPPRWFREAGDVRQAWSCEGPFGRTSPRLSGSGAQRAGIRYQRKVDKMLAKQLPGVKLGQWFAFQNGGPKVRYCQPDALWPQGEALLCLEVKVRFGPDAFWQLEDLYRPVLQRALGKDPLLGILCKHFDPYVLAPSEYVLVEELTMDAFRRADPKVGVFIWHP